METAGTLASWFLVFLAYSVLGWIIEMLAVTVINKRPPSNRGFLIGPVCPIYGCGALLMTLLLQNATNLVEIFIVAVLSSAVVEYMTSLVMEKLFRVRWWDYSEKPFNLHGRICLEGLFYFGVMGILVVEVGNPLLFGFLNSIDIPLRLSIAGVMFTILLADLLTSLWLINVCRVTVGTVQVDATEEITERVREILMGKGKLNRRLVKAFPEMEVKKKKPRQPRTKKTKAESRVEIKAKTSIRAEKTTSQSKN